MIGKIKEHNDNKNNINSFMTFNNDSDLTTNTLKSNKNSITTQGEFHTQTF